MNKKETLKTIIVDDNPEDVKNLKKCLEHYNHINIIATCDDGKSGLAAIMINNPDLVFLDMEMPDMSGIHFLESLDESVYEKCRIVVYTYYVDYMLKSFRNHAFDFLQKPINRENLNSIIRRLETAWDTPQKVISGRNAIAEKSLMTFINKVDFNIIRFNDIGVFKYDNLHSSWTIITAVQPKPIRLKRSIYNKQILALSDKFVQVHQSYIINIDHLLGVEDLKCHFYPPFQGIDDVKVGSSFYSKLMERFIKV